jgi:hypothetical protein
MTSAFAGALRVAFVALLAASALPARAMDYGFTLFGGYQDGASTRLAAVVGDLIPRAPVAFSAGVGYAVRDPGDPRQARQVFINQNTDGTPEKSGRVWDLRLDAIYLFRVAGFSELGVFAGVRRSYFMGDFKFVGGNEDFEVTANQWGWGLGVRMGWALGRDWSLTGQVGFDHYPTWSLDGHTATYASDGTIIDGRNNNNGVAYTIRDADRAINQPRFVPSLLQGVTWRPGATATPPVKGKR